MRTNRCRDDETGSVLLWTLGLVLIAVLAINLSFSVARAVQLQSRLQNATDVALLHAANHLDIDRFKQSGNLVDIKFSTAVVRQVINQQLSAAQRDYQIARLEVTQTKLILQTVHSAKVWDLAGTTFNVTFKADSAIEIYFE